MALQVNKADTKVGAAAPQAYCRLVAYIHDIVADTVAMTVNVYYNAAARNGNKDPIDSQVYSTTSAVFTGGGNTPNEQKCYNHLKTLPDFSGSVDV